MSLISRIMAAHSLDNPAPGDDFWYKPTGEIVADPITVTASSAMQSTTVQACVRVIAETIGSLPVNLYEWTADDHTSRRRATDHPLADVVGRFPNESMTKVEFWETLAGHLALRGNSYTTIEAGSRGFADSLWPLHPDFVKPELLPTKRLRFQYRPPNLNNAVTYVQDEIFYARGLGFDGVRGLSPIGLARRAVGLGLATEEHGARFFENSAQPRGALKTAQVLDDEAHDRLQETWNASYKGVRNSSKVAILEAGLEWQALGMTNEDAQFLETRKYQVVDIARVFRVPLFMIGETEKSTSWGSGIEQLSIGFVMFTLTPWVSRLENAVARDLLLEPDKYYLKFELDALMRGDIKSRTEAYSKSINDGWRTRNEVRQLEDLDPLPGLDEPVLALNVGSAPTNDTTSARAASIIHAAADRVVRKEVSAIGNIYQAERATDFMARAEDFYNSHRLFVAQVLNVTGEFADSYCEASLAELREAVSASLKNGTNEVRVLLVNWQQGKATDLATRATDKES